MSVDHASRTRTSKGFNMWCSHCETAFRTELSAYLGRKAIRCPHCDARQNLLPWEQIRLFRPEYPRKPQYGHTYPLSRVSYR